MFIPVDKMAKLREAARNGDELAKKILKAQLDKQDYISDLDSFFAPKPDKVEEKVIVEEQRPIPAPTTDEFTTGNPKLDKWLADNNIKSTDEDFKDAIGEYFQVFPDEASQTPDIFDKLNEKHEEEHEERKDCFAEMGELIVELIKKCDELLLELSQNDEISDTVRTGSMTILQEVKNSLFENASKIKKIKNSFEKSKIEKDEKLDLIK